MGTSPFSRPARAFLISLYLRNDVDGAVRVLICVDCCHATGSPVPRISAEIVEFVSKNSIQLFAEMAIPIGLSYHYGHCRLVAIYVAKPNESAICTKSCHDRNHPFATVAGSAETPCSRAAASCATMARTKPSRACNRCQYCATAGVKRSCKPSNSASIKA